MGKVYNNMIGGGSWKKVYSRSITQKQSGTYVFDNITFQNLRNWNLSGNVYIVGSWEYNGVGNDGMYNATFFPKGYLSSHLTFATGATMAGNNTSSYFWARAADIVYYANSYREGATATLEVYVQEE